MCIRDRLKLKYEGALREDIDPDLIAYMYATTMYNLQLYFCEMGLNKLEDVELCAKMVKTFYHSFFRHGIIKMCIRDRCCAGRGRPGGRRDRAKAHAAGGAVSGKTNGRLSAVLTERGARHPLRL